MGHTHYWKRSTEFMTDRFAAAVADCQAALKTIGVELAGRDGTGSPVFRSEHVVFNGKDSESCEPFEIARVEFDRRGRAVFYCFCKTNRQPYDLCVQTALIIFAHHLGDAFVVGSDVGKEDWDEARRVVGSVLGYGSEFQLAID